MSRLLPLLLLLAWASPARADDRCVRAIHLQKGDIVPCDGGDLLPTSEVLRLLLIEDALELARGDLANEQDLHAIDHDEASQVLDIERAARRECETRAAPPPLRPSRWYQSPWFAGVVGAVVGSAIVLAAVNTSR